MNRHHEAAAATTLSDSIERTPHFGFPRVLQDQDFWTATYVSVSSKTLSRAYMRGDLACVRIGSRVLISGDAIEAWLLNRERPARRSYEKSGTTTRRFGPE